MDIQTIQLLCRQEKLRWTQHIVQRLFQRGIRMDDVVQAIFSGEIIEEYPDDYPDPSCLILGRSADDQPLHIVCGIHESVLWLITAYRPDESKWFDDWKTRKDT